MVIEINWGNIPTLHKSYVIIYSYILEVISEGRANETGQTSGYTSWNLFIIGGIEVEVEFF